MFRLEAREVLTIVVKLLGIWALSSCSQERFYTPGTDDGDQTNRSGPGVARKLSEDFAARYSQQTDILAIVDNSGSMSQEIAAVKEALDSFHLKLNGRRTNDYRFAVVTTDAYTHLGDFVSAQNISVVNGTSPGAVEAARGILDNIKDSPNSYWEQGLKSSELALRKNALRFLRAGVDLALIYISDEEDYSCLDNNGSDVGQTCPGMDEKPKQPQDFAAPRPWTGVTIDHYKTFLQSLGRTVLPFAIVGVAGTKCEESSKGTRYLALQTALGAGFTAPICNDQLAANFTRIAEGISRRGDCYKLSSPVDVDEEIRVTVNGFPIPQSRSSGFAFDAATNAVCFTGSLLPQQGQTIKVSYTEKLTSP